MSSKAQEKKDEVISDLIEARRQILNVAYTLPPDKRDEVFLGVWSVRHLLAHLVGWDLTNIEAVKAMLDGRLPGFYSQYDRGWKTYNACLVEQYQKQEFAEFLSSVEKSHRQLVDFLGTIPADEFDKDRGLRFKRYKVTIARLLQAEADDEKEHSEQISEFRQGSIAGK